jgi:hypothetical protein
MSETETEIGWRVARGELPSPQRMPGFALFALRFSGTGTAWRESLGEHVYRPPAEYLTPEMCRRVAGVPVVAVHPASGALDTASFVRTVVGSVMFGYIAGPDGILSDAGDELWCVARIGDETAADAMATGQFSTSPAVVFAADSGNEKMRLPDGTSILFEGRPAILDHLAAMIDAGVWDHDGRVGPGVRTDSISTKEKLTMTEEERAAKEREDKALRDDAARKRDDEKLDKVLAGLDSVHKRLDALEKPDDDDAKKRRADAAKARRDAEREAWHREDAAACARDDAEEETERTRMIERGEPEETAADAARQARRDRVKARKDAASGLRHGTPLQAAKDAEREREEDHNKADAQKRADAVAQAFGERAPAPMMGEATLAYRKRLLRGFQRHSVFKDANLDTIAADSATFANVESAIYADAVKASATPDVPAGHRIARVRTTDSGHRITEWFGDTIFKSLSAPTMRVAAFNVPQNRGA